MKYYVYVLLDSSKSGEFIYGGYKFEYEPFYVGKGCGDRIKNTMYDNSKFKSNKILKLKRNNVHIISLKVSENITNEESIVLEKSLISLIGRRDLGLGSLVNTTDGGDGRTNSPHSDEVRQKISKNRMGKGIGWNHNNKTLKDMSDSQSGIGNGFYGKKHSNESRDRISAKNSGNNHPMYNKNHSEDVINKIKLKRNNLTNERLKESCQVFNKEVSQYNLDMEFIRSYKSVKEASSKLNINESIISKCCRGDILNPTRFFFKYTNEESKIKNNKFLITDTFKQGKINYKIVKRNKTSAICLDLDKGEEVTIRYKDCPILEVKEKNDSDFVELYLFASRYGKFDIDRERHIIFNDSLKIYYNKLYENSELFIGRKEIFDRCIDGEKVVNIFEDQWLNKKDVVKSRLSNLMGKSKTIYARKCDIRNVDHKEKKDFIDRNHIQGDIRSKINIGLYYDDKLVSIMTFGGLRKNLGQVSKEGHFELLRFCNELNTTVVGGASKIFKNFLENNEVISLISYIDRCWGYGSENLYTRLGFTPSKNKVMPSYFYIVDGMRKNRFGYRKDILVSEGFDINLTEGEIQNSRGYYKIFDCGSMKYEYNNVKK